MTTTSAFVLKNLTVKSRTGPEWLCLCPYHKDTNPSFSINIKKKLFICYACGAKGNIKQLMEYMGFADTHVQTEEIVIDELSERIKAAQKALEQTQRPPVGVPIPPRIYTDMDKMQEYWVNKRWISHEAMKEYKLGYDILADEAVIPVSNFNGHNIGLIRRSFDATRPRYLYSKGMKTSEVVFGANEAMRLANRSRGKNGVLVITEGAVDAMTVYNKEIHQQTSNGLRQPMFAVGVAVLGSRISLTQALIIKKMGFQTIVIATDMDRAGKAAQIQIEHELRAVSTPAFIKTANWNEEWGKDINGLYTNTEKGGATMLQAILSQAVSS